MSGLEVQANQIASLLTGSFYRTPPTWFPLISSILGAIWISGSGLWALNSPQHKLQRWWLSGTLFLLVGYGGFVLFMFTQQWMLPILLPPLVWSATGVSVFIFTLLKWQEKLITQQYAEITQLAAAEKSAILEQAQKLLQRTASDIHDGPLQDLKLLMDKVELAPTDTNAILDRLEAVGLSIREHLSNIRNLSEKLEISPELKQGLDQGICQRLQELTHSSKLTLQVTLDLQKLPEAATDKEWIANREEIYRFFQEAISNVIHHAQPPRGTATQVLVRLNHQQGRALLIVENNGTHVSPASLPQRTGGYGTKLMETIALELPEGVWERLPLEDGGMRVTPSWTLRQGL